MPFRYCSFVFFHFGAHVPLRVDVSEVVLSDRFQIIHKHSSDEGEEAEDSDDIEDGAAAMNAQ